MAEVMGVTITKTYTRNSTKELLVLRNKITKCITNIARELGYEIDSIIVGDGEDVEKSLTITITKVNTVEHESLIF